MRIETLKTRTSPVRGSSIKSFFRRFDLLFLIARMKHSKSWAKGELNSTILLKKPEKQIVLTIMHGGTEIHSFQSGDSVTIQVIEGKLTLLTRTKSVDINKLQFFTLQDKIEYTLSCSEETAFILTIEKKLLLPKNQMPVTFKKCFS